MNESYSSFNSGDKQQPLNHSGAASLNDRIDTSYIDVSHEDTSMLASVTRTIVDTVGRYVTPRQMLGVLRVLKALTLCFLLLTILSDLMYLALLEVFSASELKKLAGGSKDMFTRFYALFLSVLAIAIEFDITKIVKHFSGLRGFIPRGLLLFFIATLTTPHPIHQDDSASSSSNSSSYYADDYTNDDNAYNDDGDDAYSSYGYQTAEVDTVTIPRSAVVFQGVTSFILGVCALVYLGFGLLCFDRFTSRAFLSSKDPVVTTAIPQPGGVHHSETRSEDSDVV